ncbi:NAD(P)-binding protein [Penicillium angulare]|uniref:NAD(P)-binding protein n=1 Tax=Penicillium angulare TaxID=116970 RepID=A0A9W9KC94_9EURO|nr:NAD(P)-binding protein [Penicillium angulare]
MSTRKKVLVTGASGNQGTGVVLHCLATGQEVYAFVHNSHSSKELKELGAKIITGDFDDVETMCAALQDKDTVFHTEVQTGDWAGDLQRSTNVIEAARNSPTVSQFILSSAIKTGQHESFPGWGLGYPMRQYWVNKHTIESRVREAGFQYWTIIRMGQFLQNLKYPLSALTFPGFVSDRVLRVAWRPDTKIPWVDATDVGILASVATLDPPSYTHSEIDLATEALTVEELGVKLDVALREKVKIHYLSKEEEEAIMRTGSPVPAAHQWANQVPCWDAIGRVALPLTPVDKFLAENATLI